MNPLSTAALSMRRSPYQTLAVIMIMAVTFLVTYVVSLLLVGTNQVLRFFESQPQIIGFFNLSATDSDIETLNKELQQKSFVSKTKVVTKQQALELYQTDNKDEPLLLELVTADILPASIEVSGNNIEDLVSIKNALEANPQIEEVVYQQDVVDSLSKWTDSLRQTGIGASIVLLITSVLITLVVVSMKVSNKKTVIQIMRMIGATRWYITSPFLFEGALYGIIGSLLGWIGSTLLLLYLTPWLTDFLSGIPLFPIPWQVFAVQLGIGTAAGLLLGATVGTIAVRRLFKH
jgi:cell division transport system permease protein